MIRKSFSGIYKITQVEMNYVYVGQSKDVKGRLNSHKKLLIGGFHPNHSLQRDWDIYGETSFSFEALEMVEESSLAERELFWIEYYRERNFFTYNTIPSNEKTRLLMRNRERRVLFCLDLLGKDTEQEKA